MAGEIVASEGREISEGNTQEVPARVIDDEAELRKKFGMLQWKTARHLQEKSKDDLLRICVDLDDRFHRVRVALSSSWVNKALDAADAMARDKKRRSNHREQLISLLREGSTIMGDNPVICGIAPDKEAADALYADPSEKERSLDDALKAAKAARAADKAGFEAVIRDLREEVARLKGAAK